jgi:hypothetical protein
VQLNARADRNLCRDRQVASLFEDPMEFWTGNAAHGSIGVQEGQPPAHKYDHLIDPPDAEIVGSGMLTRYTISAD